MRDRLLAVEGFGIGSVNMLSGSPSFTSVSISPSCHNGERSWGVGAFGPCRKGLRRRLTTALFHGHLRSQK